MSTPVWFIVGLIGVGMATIAVALILEGRSSDANVLYNDADADAEIQGYDGDLFI